MLTKSGSLSAVGNKNNLKGRNSSCKETHEGHTDDAARHSSPLEVAAVSGRQQQQGGVRREDTSSLPRATAAAAPAAAAEGAAGAGRAAPVATQAAAVDTVAATATAEAAGGDSRRERTTEEGEEEEDWELTPEHLQQLKKKYGSLEHPLFMDEMPRDVEGHPQVHALQQLVYDGETPVTVADRMRAAGNTWLQEAVAHKTRKKQQQALRNAVDCYTHGLSQECGDKKLNAVLLTNRAHCHLLLHEAMRCRDDCRRALALDPQNIKAYYRGAKAALQLELFREAADFAEAGLRIDSSNAALASLAATAHDKQQQLAQRRQQQQQQEQQQQQQQTPTTITTVEDVLRARGVTVVPLDYSLGPLVQQSCAHLKQEDEEAEEEAAVAAAGDAQEEVAAGDAEVGAAAAAAGAAAAGAAAAGAGRRSAERATTAAAGHAADSPRKRDGERREGGNNSAAAAASGEVVRAAAGRKKELICFFTVLLLFDEPGVTETITDFDERCSLRFYLSHMFPSSAARSTSSRNSSSSNSSSSRNSSSACSVPFVAWDKEKKYVVDHMCLFYECGLPGDVLLQVPVDWSLKRLLLATRRIATVPVFHVLVKDSKALEHFVTHHNIRQLQN